MEGYKKTQYPGSIQEYHLVLSTREMADVLRVLQIAGYGDIMFPLLVSLEKKFRVDAGLVIDEDQLRRINELVNRDIRRYQNLFVEFAKLI